MPPIDERRIPPGPLRGGTGRVHRGGPLKTGGDSARGQGPGGTGPDAGRIAADVMAAHNRSLAGNIGDVYPSLLTVRLACRGSARQARTLIVTPHDHSGLDLALGLNVSL